MESHRRRFLHVVGAAAAAAALPDCAASNEAPTPTHHHSSSSGSSCVGGGGMGGAGGAGGSGGSCGDGCDPNPSGVAVGTPSYYEVDGLHMVANTSILIGRDAEGLYALSSICTHQGCNMNK